MDLKAEALAGKANPVNALMNAADRGVAELPDKASFKLPVPLKARVVQICALTGTDLSSFLRECCENLRSAYDGPEGG